MRIRVSTFRFVLLIAACCGAVNGCVVAVGGAALGGAIVVTDRRSMGMQLEDAQIEYRINSALDNRFTRESVHIEVTSYNQKVLLTGQVPHDKDRNDAEAIASESENVRMVVNELTIGSLSGLSSQGDDNMLAGKVRSALLDVPGLATGTVKVTCADGTVYLFGRVGTKEAEIAERAASHVNGVKRVVALFDLLSDAELAQYLHEAPSNAPLPAGNSQ